MLKFLIGKVEECCPVPEGNDEHVAFVDRILIEDRVTGPDPGHDTPLVHFTEWTRNLLIFEIVTISAFEIGVFALTEVHSADIITNHDSTAISPSVITLSLSYP